MAKSPTQTVNRVLMTPEMARALLEVNHINRRLRPRFVNYLADELVAGRWELTSSAIATNEQGALTNGQHRLHAIVQAKRSAWVLLATNLTERSFRVEDTGVKRSLSDSLGISNQLGADLSTALNLLTAGHNNRISPEVFKDALVWWQPVEDALRGALDGAPTDLRLLTSPLRVGFGARWAVEPSGPNRNYILEQFDAYRHNDPTRMSRAVATLWRRITQGRNGVGMRKMPERITQVVAIYHALEPKRRDVEPALAFPVAVRDEIAWYLQRMDGAYMAGPDRHGHPYLWAERPTVQRRPKEVAAAAWAKTQATLAAKAAGGLSGLPGAPAAQAMNGGAEREGEGEKS